MLLMALAAVEAAAGAGLLVLRRRVVGESAQTLLGVVAVATVAALIIGTTVQVSGVALAVPVVAGVALVLLHSEWRSGDLAMLTLVAAAGSALGYQLAATIDPDTGSYGDQGALLLAVLAVPVGLFAALSARRRIRTQAPR